MALPDLTLFRHISAAAFAKVLDAVTGSKTLVLSPSLTGALGLITDVTLMRKHGVTKMFWLENGALPPNAERQIVYVCRPEVASMRLIAEQIKNAPEAVNHTFALIVSPQMSSVCTSTLSEEGVLGSLDHIYSLPLGLIPLETDLLSLELPDAWPRLSRDADYTPTYDLARALITVQDALGPIQRMVAKGDHASYLCKTLHRLARETEASGSKKTQAKAPFQLDSMIVIDRKVDLITPLCTQLTYEGLLDEVYGIKGAHIEVDLDPKLTSEPSTSATKNPKKARHHLSSTVDKVFPELRDTNFAVVGSVLNRIARRLNDDYQKRHTARTPAELRQFVGQLGELQSEHQSLKLHTTLAEKIMAVTTSEEFNSALEVQQNLLAGIDISRQEEGIRNLLYQGAPLTLVLRLLCIYSIVTGGIKIKLYDEFRKEILESYGYEYLTLLLYLEKLGLLSRWSSTKPSFVTARKPLKLIVDDVDEEKPKDISYVFSGYAPLSVRLVQYCISGSLNKKINIANNQLNGWKGLEDVLKSLPGPSYEWASSSSPISSTTSPSLGSSDPLISLIVYIGGVTYAEIAALRLTARKYPNRQFVILTTNMINGNTLIDSLVDVHRATALRSS